VSHSPSEAGCRHELMIPRNNEACDPQGSWPFYTFWQNADTNDYGGDSDVFNGDLTQLKKLAIG